MTPKPYIEFKKNLGYKFKEAEYVYAAFDRLVCKRGESNIGVTRDLAEAWAVRNLNECDSTHYKRIMYLIQFSAYLCDVGYMSFIPSYHTKYKSKFTPYILTESQINDILDVCDKTKPKNIMSSHDYVLPAMLRFMYGTGIRVGEATSMLTKNVDIQQRLAVVHNSKNGRDRIVTFSESVAKVCEQYRGSLPVSSITCGYFFVRRNGQPCNKKQMYEWFRVALRKAGIHHGGRGFGPRLHDVRHSFSVHSLAQMASNGIDLYYALPILSEYLGHQSLEATEKYVRLTAEMYPGLISQVDKICSYVFPHTEPLDDD